MWRRHKEEPKKTVEDKIRERKAQAAERKLCEKAIRIIASRDESESVDAISRVDFECSIELSPELCLLYIRRVRASTSIHASSWANDSHHTVEVKESGRVVLRGKSIDSFSFPTKDIEAYLPGDWEDLIEEVHAEIQQREREGRLRKQEEGRQAELAEERAERRNFGFEE